MRKLKNYFLPILFVNILIVMVACKKDNISQSSLYTPTSADVTANATLPELQEGRILYIDNCNACHGLYPPENYAPTQWKSILNVMGPRTNMSASDIQLVTKYVCKGLQ